MIKNIIFDIGGVLAGFDWKSYLHTFGFEREKEEAIADAVFRGPYWKELDRGAVSIPELLELFISLAPQYREDIVRVFDTAQDCIFPLDYAKPWIRSLKARGYRVYYLSNYSEHTRNLTQEALDFLPLMDGGLFSYEVRQIKPDREIFQSLITRHPEIRPEESVFFDDTAPNVEAARAFGMKGFVFRGQEQAERELEELTGG